MDFETMRKHLAQQVTAEFVPDKITGQTYVYDVDRMPKTFLGYLPTDETHPKVERVNRHELDMMIDSEPVDPRYDN